MAFGKALPRVALATVLTAALVPNSAHAQIPIPEARWVSEVAGTCEPGLAFGKPLGEHYGGNPVVWAGEAAAPLRFVEFTRTPRSRKLISAELTAAFASDLGERDILALAAQSLVDRVDGAIGAAGVLSDRRTDPETGAVVWSSLSADGLSGVRMELLAVETAAYFLCQDVAMVRLAADEAAGRARAEVDAFVAAGGQDVGRVLGAAAVQYEDLVQWYGQQILDKGGWTQAEREAFAEEVQFDEVITSGWTTQVDGGNILIAFQLNVAEEADAMEACETALGVNRIVRMIEDVNHQQWDRLTELYGAEAVRRGVSLD